MDNQWSFRICVQNQGLLKKFLETAKFLFLIKVQVHVTPQWNHLHESSLINQIAKEIEIFRDKKCQVTFGLEYISLSIT